MKKQALGWVVAGSLLVSSTLAAEPLNDLRARLTAMRNDQPTRIKVEVEVEHRGSAPLHLSGSKKRGRAIVAYGPQGVKMLDQRWLTTSTRFSVWGAKGKNELPLIDDVEARVLADPAAMLDALLEEATLLSDEAATWQGQPARFLVFRPGVLAPRRPDENAAAEGPRTPFALEVRIWLDESGVPLAMERLSDLRLGPALAVTEHQNLTFQQIGGRLLVAESRETYSGAALAVLRGRDAKKMKVTEVR